MKKSRTDSVSFCNDGSGKLRISIHRINDDKKQVRNYFVTGKRAEKVWEISRRKFRTVSTPTFLDGYMWIMLSSF